MAAADDNDDPEEPMARTQVFLRRDQMRWLEEQATGDRTKASLIRKALDLLIARERKKKPLAPKDDPEYQAAVDEAFGALADDPDFERRMADIRKGWSRRMERLWRGD